VRRALSAGDRLGGGNGRCLRASHRAVLSDLLLDPPHFWALALYVRPDYAAAGIPMLPVVAGERETRRQIWGYTAIMAVAAFAPVLLGLTGPLYGTVAVVAT
jgi:heme O synthase-like polyprenyltransferase